MGLSPQHLKTVEAQYSGSAATQVIAALQRLTTAQTMNSAVNLDNTIGAILSLSDGNFERLESLVGAASIDFRDVIYWWTLKQRGSS